MLKQMFLLGLHKAASAETKLEQLPSITPRRLTCSCFEDLWSLIRAYCQMRSVTTKEVKTPKALTALS